MNDDYAKIFNDVGYVHLKGFLDKENCQQLCDYMNKEIEDKNTSKDTQCPLSESIHGSFQFDSLLEQLLPQFEFASGKKLLPTYAYARKYIPGEVLKIHRDRPACEISATVTLGFSGKKWPIYMGHPGTQDDGNQYSTESNKAVYIKNETPIEMDVGDAVLYHGQDLYHWRNKFEGDWQIQVFLHYVDANGQNAAWKYDKRQCLTHHKPMLSPNIEILNHGQAIVFHGAFSKDSCAKIIQQIEKEQGEMAGVGSGETSKIDKKIRDVNRLNIPIDRGIGATLTGIGMNINNLYFNFDVSGSTQSEFLRYGIGGHYNTHIDTFFNLKDSKINFSETRKLTILLFLNDDFEDGKLFLRTGDEKYYPPQEAGNVLVFPSFFPHSVDTVTKGKRVSLVNWLIGPMFI